MHLRLLLLLIAPFTLTYALDLAASLSQVLAGDTQTAPGSWRWDDCSLPGSAVKVTSLELSPDPPTPGTELIIHASGHAFETIGDGAYADVSVKAGLIKILQKRFDICLEAANANFTLQCPVEEGDHSLIQSIDLPSEIPKFVYAINVKGFTAADADMLCLNINIDFRPPK